AQDKDELYRKYLDRHYAVQVVLSWYSPTFYEAGACQACNDPKFAGLNPAEVISPCKDAMRSVQVLKDEEARLREKLRLQEEAARERQNMSILADLEKKQREAEEELREMKLKHMKDMESQFKVILDQAIASASKALSDGQA
ncbi:hypothetical protein FOZ63_018218, partial [Perkinsus olseni]